MRPTTTGRLAEFVAGLRYEDVPAPVIERVKRQTLDLVGVALAGSAQPVGRLALRQAERQASCPQATVWGSNLKVSALDAAFSNGVAAHALDFDDMWLPSAHPSAPTLPAALAVAEAQGASGKDLLVAQTAAYEVIGKLSSAVTGHRIGWHTTAIFGGFGAAAASARLLRLDERRLATAWGIATSAAGGIDGQEGTMTKPFHAGNAARSGVMGAVLAADGFTANDHVFDPDEGFFEAFFRGIPADSPRITLGLGDPYHLMSPGIGIKMYPAGYFMHHTFEAALQLVLEHDLHPEDIREVEIGLRTERNFNHPVIRSGLEGKFSLQYMAAMAIVDRALTIESFTDEHALSESVQGMLARTRARVDRSITPNRDLTYNPVTLRLQDGRELTAIQPMPKSHWRYLLPREEWVGKFRRNAGYVFDQQRTDRIRAVIERLEELEDVRELTELLKG
jgi:2-methylcitrate dehydratase PrpD